jgi:hypothetical protein
MSAATSAAPAGAAVGIDPRAPQFNAAVTLVVLVVALTSIGTRLATVLTAIQLALFLLGAIAGVARTPHAAVFRRFIKPRLSAPDHLEDPAPPRFAQAVGAVFTAVALVGLLADLPVLAAVALGFATVAATLNAFFRFCLGCEVYLLIRRLAPVASTGSAH